MFKVNDLIDVILVFLLLTLNIFLIIFIISIVDFEQENVSWDVPFLCPWKQRDIEMEQWREMY